MKTKDNAANRDSFVGKIYTMGEKDYKSNILNSLKNKWKNLHINGYIHIHDLDAYGITYNCLTFDLLKSFPFEEFNYYESEETKIIRYFDFLKELFENIGNEQSGGMAIANFDIDTALIFKKLNINIFEHREIIKASMYSFVLWCNNMHTRMGMTSYYVTLNIGLGKEQDEKEISKILLEVFELNHPLSYKPNIVFKVKQGISLNEFDPNYDLLLHAIKVTNKKMIPTYLMCDCYSDKDIDPKKLSIVGCRSRIVSNLFSEPTTIGRGNISNISINLVRIALDLKKVKKLSIQNFIKEWTKIANEVKDILIDRFNKTCKSDISLFATNYKYKLIMGDFDKSLYDVFKNGTLSIGFIGLSETLELITNKKYWLDEHTYKMGIDLIKYMRFFCDNLTKENNLNFSLLAPSGELISSRFLEIDKQIYSEDFMNKGFYTNSFHVEVDSGISALEKLTIESPFHRYCNGGSITYVELNEAPIKNIEGVYDIIKLASKTDVRYLGFNFKRDFCNECQNEGIFNNKCLYCGSNKITRIRRVSGYLEVQDYFTKGKYYESKRRKQN